MYLNNSFLLLKKEASVIMMGTIVICAYKETNLESIWKLHLCSD